MTGTFWSRPCRCMSCSCAMIRASKPAKKGGPAVIEVLCDECEKELNFADFDEQVRNELLLTLGAR